MATAKDALNQINSHEKESVLYTIKTLKSKMKVQRNLKS